METFEIDIRELGVSQLYLNQRKLEAVREKTLGFLTRVFSRTSSNSSS